MTGESLFGRKTEHYSDPVAEKIGEDLIEYAQEWKVEQSEGQGKLDEQFFEEERLYLATIWDGEHVTVLPYNVLEPSDLEDESPGENVDEDFDFLADSYRKQCSNYEELQDFINSLENVGTQMLLHTTETKEIF